MARALAGRHFVLYAKGSPEMIASLCDANTGLTPDLSTLDESRYKSCVHCVSKENVPPLACYNFDNRETILVFFGRNITDKVTGWPQTWKNLEYSGNSLSLEHSWNSRGILCNLREKLKQIK